MKRIIARPKITSWRLLLFALAVLVCIGFARTSAATNAVTLTGTLLPIGPAEGLRDYVIRFQGQEWLFKISEVDVRESRGGILSGWATLNRIGQNRITLVGGDEETLRILSQPDVLCEGLRIRGTLYLSNGILALASVEKTPEHDSPEKCD